MLRGGGKGVESVGIKTYKPSQITLFKFQHVVLGEEPRFIAQLVLGNKPKKEIFKTVEQKTRGEDYLNR
jgi:hypothetical protein